MEWQDTTEEQDEALEALHQPFEVLREVPHVPTTRVRSITATDRDRETAALDLDLRAFPPLSKGEPKELRLKRMQACQQTWRELESDIKDVLDAANAETFDRIAEYAFEKHSNPRKRRKTGARPRMVATALAVAGSINAADHAETFPSLASCLRSKGCYAALLGSRDLPSGGSVALALNTILRQFSSLATDADDMQALLSWYEDETEAGCGTGGKGEGEADGILSPLGKMGLTSHEKAAGKTKAKRKQRTDKQESQEGGGGVTSPFGKLALHTPQKVTLRPRSGQQQDPAALQAVKVEAAEKEDTAQKPLVVIVEGVEGVDPLLLQDLILVLSENQAELPVVLVLGMSTSASALAQVPTAASDMLATRNFHLVQALAKLEAVFRQVLVGGNHNLSFGQALMRDLDDHFMRHDFTVRTLQQGLKLACLSHFQGNELSHLAPLTPPEMEVAVVGLPPASGKRFLELIGLPARSTAGLETLQEALQVSRRWKAGLQMVNAIAHATGRKAMTDGFSLRELYREASSPTFSASNEAKLMQLALQRGLEALDPPAAAGLLETLVGLAAGLGPDASDLLQDCQAAVGSHHSRARLGNSDSDAAEHDQETDAMPEKEGDVENRDPNPAGPAEASAEGAAQGGGEGATKATKGRGAAGRRNALVKAVQVSKETVRPGRATEQGSSARTVSAQVSRMLEAAFQAMSHPPCELKGGSAFCVMDGSRKRGLLGMACRPTLDLALSRPEVYLGGEALGLCAEQQDTAIAYQLLSEYGEDVDVADWFAGFSTVYQSHPVVEVVDKEPSPAKKGRRDRGRGSRKVNQDEKGDQAAAAAVEAARKQKKAAKRTVKPATEEGASANQEEAGEDSKREAVPEYKIPLEELVARFTQATNELQLLGVVRGAARKRRGNHTQRLVWAA